MIFISHSKIIYCSNLMDRNTKKKKTQFTALQIIICIPFLFTRTKIFQHVRKQPYVSAKRLYTKYTKYIYIYLSTMRP